MNIEERLVVVSNGSRWLSRTVEACRVCPAAPADWLLLLTAFGDRAMAAGWDGREAPIRGRRRSCSRRRRAGALIALKAVPLSRDEVSKFYSGFANEIIWPLFHDMPSRCNFDPEYWKFISG